MELEFFADPAAFLDAAGDLLAADPVLGSVIASVSERIARELAERRRLVDRGRCARSTGGGWSCATRRATVVSAAMRTAPFKP